jgi:hypothetical protein
MAILLTISNDLSSRLTPVRYSMSSQVVKASLRLAALGLAPLALLLLTGYHGHDEMAVVESTFVRRFPIYGQGGDSSSATGKTRQLQYKLAAGEAGWVLKFDKMMEY